MDRGGSQSESGDGRIGPLVASEISEWLGDRFRTLSLSEEAEGYLLGRGATPESIVHFGFVEWGPSKEKAPDESFRKKYGEYGQYLEGQIAYPLYAPSGRLIGFEARSRHEKKITEFRTPEASWNPVLVNAPEAARKMWSGGSVWVTEGMWDLLPLRMVIPAEDVVVATLRARLSPTHVTFFTRFLQGRVNMVYDNDETGRKATLGWKDDTGKWRFGALGLLKKAGLRGVDFRYRGKDPGEVWSSGGIGKMRRVFLGESQ